MDLRDLANIFNTKNNSDFMNLEVTVNGLNPWKELFHGTIEEFIEAIYFHELDDRFTVCEIMRRPTQLYDDTPECNRPMRITVI